jgi:hypothetical protein
VPSVIRFLPSAGWSARCAHNMRVVEAYQAGAVRCMQCERMP